MGTMNGVMVQEESKTCNWNGSDPPAIAYFIQKVCQPRFFDLGHPKQALQNFSSVPLEKGVKQPDMFYFHTGVPTLLYPVAALVNFNAAK